MTSIFNTDTQSELILEFISITGEGPIEALKYIKQGKGNLQMSLNYYYNKEDKRPWQYGQNPKQTQQPTSLKQSFQAQQPASDTMNNAFTELKQGSMKQHKLGKLIKDLRDEYSKPIEEQLKMNQIVPSGSEKQLSYFPQMLEQDHRPNIIPHSIELKNQIMRDEQHNSLDDIQVEISDLNSTPGKISELNSYEYEKKSKESKEMQTTKMKEEFPKPLIEQTQKVVGKKLNIKIDKNLNKIVVDYPLMLGQCIITAISGKSQNLRNIQRGMVLQIEVEGYQKDVKKGRKGQLKDRKDDIVIRVLHEKNEIGRFEKCFEDIFSPLLYKNYITIKVCYEYSNDLCSIFDPITLKLDVYLLECAMTQIDDQNDTCEIIEKQKVFLDTKDQFSNLFQLLKLQMSQTTLIKLDKSNHLKSRESEIQVNLTDKKTEKQNINPLNNVNYKDPYQKQPTQTKLQYLPASVDDVLRQQNVKNIHIMQQNQIEFQSKNENENENETDNLDYDQLFKLQEYDDLELFEPAGTFISKLYDYQKQALHWMLTREGAIQTDLDEKLRVLHPLWEEYILEKQKLFLYFSPFSGNNYQFILLIGLLSLNIPKSSQKCKGGILADEMGLGKTIMFLSLIHTNNTVPKKVKPSETMRDLPPAANKIQQKKQTNLNFYLHSSTFRQAKNLIVVPMTLISQWKSEILTHSKQNSLSVYEYYGNDRTTDNIDQYDIVLTTYGVVRGDYGQSKPNKITLFDFEWFRIILDEAHYIKGRTIQIAQAVYNLKCQIKWCSTGTPMQNKLDDLFSLVHFIKLEPWSQYQWWNTHINKEFEKGGESSNTVLEMVRVIMNPVILRRTKKSKKKDGSYIITLPNKNILYYHIKFSEEEQDIYQRMEKKSIDELEGYISKGLLLSKYMQFLEIILRLRQICDHHFLIQTRSNIKNLDQLEVTLQAFLTKSKIKKVNTKLEEDENQYEILMDDKHQEIKFVTQSNKHFTDISQELNQIKKYKDDLIGKIKDNNIGDCPVCMDKIEDAVVTSCLHLLCRLCMKGVMANQHCCPICRQFLSKEDYMTLPRDNEFTFDWKANYKRSSKVEAIVNIVREQVLTTKNDKCVIFTQFIGMIDLVQFDMLQQGIKIIRMDGKLNLNQRQSVIKQFNEDPECRIFMVSLKTGGVGLNLVAANHVIMVDPWWNPAVEDQAIERIYRIGQKKEVFVHRLTIQDSIEERIIQMHKDKKLLFENTISTNEDKKQIRLQHFKHLLLL